MQVTIKQSTIKAVSLAMAKNDYRTYYGLSQKHSVAIGRNGTGAGGIFFEGFACIIMPWRSETHTEGIAEIKAPLTVKPKLMAA